MKTFISIMLCSFCFNGKNTLYINNIYFIITSFFLKVQDRVKNSAATKIDHYTSTTTQL